MNVVSTRAGDSRWWLPIYEDDRAIHLNDVAVRLWRGLQSQRDDYERDLSLYTSRRVGGLSPRMYRTRATQMTQRSAPVGLPIITPIVDTYTAMITKDRPKVCFETSGGDDTLQRRAKRLTKFIDGIFYDTNLYETANAVARDSAVFGMGVVKIYRTVVNGKPKIKIERIHPEEVMIDEEDAYYGDPQTMYQVKWVDKRALEFAFPDRAEEIDQASSSAFMDASTTETYAMANARQTKCVTIEAWHLPSDPGPDGSKDGRHVLCVGNVALIDEEWDGTQGFPFEFVYRKPPVYGIWGESLPNELRSIQYEINMLMFIIHRSNKMAVGHWMVEENARVNTNELNDKTAGIIRYTGSEPHWQVGQSAAPDVYTQLDRLWERGFEVIGVSQQTSAGSIPAGIKSGKAMLVYADIQAQRFQPSYRAYQHFFLRIARQIIHLSRDIEKTDPGFEVKATGTKQMMKTVKWADANLEDEEFTLQMAATNKLADDPAAKLEVVQNMINAGMISPEDGKRLLDLPDLEAFNEREDAPYNYVMKCVDRIVEDGDYHGPEPYMGPYLQQAIHIMQYSYLNGRIDGVPDDRLELMRRWIDEASSILVPPQPPAPPPQPGAGPTLPQRTQDMIGRREAGEAATALGAQ